VKKILELEFGCDSVKKHVKSDTTFQNKASTLLVLFLLVCIYIAL